MNKFFPLEMKRINYSFVCLTLSALVVSSIVIALLNKISPLFSSKTLFLCQKFISDVMFELPSSLPNVFISAIGVVLGIGLLSFLLQLCRTHLLLRKLLINKVNIPKGLVGVVATLGLTNKVILINNNNLFSFCCGVLSPQIVVTTGLVRSLTKKELEAVFLHEQSHLVSRDPIKVLIGKTFSSMFFFLPVFAELHKNIEAVNELLADQCTINYQQKSTFLRGALKKILATPQANMNFVSNISGPDFFEIRIHRLVNPGMKHKFRLSLVSLVTTFLFVFMSWFLLQTPVSAFHMDSKSNSTYFLCSQDQSCTEQCHPYSEKPATYIPANPFLPEKKCDDTSHPSKTSLKSFSTERSDDSISSQVPKYQSSLLNH